MIILTHVHMSTLHPYEYFSFTVVKVNNKRVPDCRIFSHALSNISVRNVQDIQDSLKLSRKYVMHFKLVT